MQLGFVSAILGDLSFEEVIKFAGESGYECVEIICWPAGVADRRYAGSQTFFTVESSGGLLAKSSFQVIGCEWGGASLRR